MGLKLPKDYKDKLDIMETQIAIKKLKDYFELRLSRELNLTRVSSPLFVLPETGMNDNLNGEEKAVNFNVPSLNNKNAEIVQSLAKWKRMALKRYGFSAGSGLYTDMNAIRKDEELDNLHSLYVDQWDWELVINKEDRNVQTLKETVEKLYRVFKDTEVFEELDNLHSLYVDQWDWELVINKEDRNVQTLKETVEKLYRVFKDTEVFVCSLYPHIPEILPEEITFITSQELLDKYPGLDAKARENEAVKDYGAVFIMQIGKVLSNGEKHDGRSPDYDDWELNGDILFYNPVLDDAIELSSMGIRVDEESLDRQLTLAGCDDRRELDYHKMLLNGELPYTVGGGIGQSRICMYYLRKAHIGEVQVGIWPEDQIEACEKAGIKLL